MVATAGLHTSASACSCSGDCSVNIPQALIQARAPTVSTDKSLSNEITTLKVLKKKPKTKNWHFFEVFEELVICLLGTVFKVMCTYGIL